MHGPLVSIAKWLVQYQYNTTYDNTVGIYYIIIKVFEIPNYIVIILNINCIKIYYI